MSRAARASAPSSFTARRTHVGRTGSDSVGMFTPPGQGLTQMMTPSSRTAQQLWEMDLKLCHRSNARGWALVMTTSAGVSMSTP